MICPLSFALGRYVFPEYQASVLNNQYDDGYSAGYFDALDPVDQYDSYSVWPGAIKVDVTDDDILIPKQVVIINHYAEGHDFGVKVADMNAYFVEKGDPKPAKPDWLYAFPITYHVDGLRRGLVGFFVRPDRVPRGDWYCGLLIYRTDVPQEEIPIEYSVIVVISHH